MAHDSSDWSRHYDEGRGFRPLGAVERDLLARHTPAPEGGRALDVGCGTGELAAHLTTLGYTVDALDFAEGALDRARKEQEGAEGVRWLRLDIERDDLSVLHDGGYDLITLRLAYAFVRDRTRVMHQLAARLRPGGALVVITPVEANTPEARRRIALDEDEIDVLAETWEEVERCDADGLAFLVLRGPGGFFEVVEKRRPQPHAVFGACAVVTDADGRVLLGRSTRGMWELPGGRVETGESAQAAAVRELAEETGLRARCEDAQLLTILHDDRADVVRVSAVVRVTAWSGTPQVSEPHRFTRWEWHDPHDRAGSGRVFAPSASALAAVWPGVLPGLPSVHSYSPCPHADLPPLTGTEPTGAEPAGAGPTGTGLRRKAAPVRTSGIWLPPEQYVATLPKATVYACFFVTDRDDRPIQLRSVRNPALWQWPGGNLDDPGETPWDCALRECMEETGLRIADEPRLLAVHFLPPTGGWTTHKVGFVFDGGQLDQDRIDRIVLDPDEHTEVAVRPLEEWRTRMSPFSFRLLAAVAEARRTGSACYLAQSPPSPGAH
ncbi:bifunctional class I SAM-dependent methyltransferase/NUDIX hydrolase [Streptomyces albus]|uniref:bifunctional class I SAM-dependent methyltransferase/NUDIX hydrolase n=1 Tax=Streptomyces sp. NRRL F-5639 TaxID=1463867 RepID=UPI0007C781BE|nr:NUDIX domain-containing protein [Streptomyces sp. NRRL F-5639]